MKIKVHRMVIKDWNSLVEERGSKADFIEVPTTAKGVRVRGIFTDDLKQAIAVAWPIDRPQEHQAVFARECTRGGYPVDDLDRDQKGTLVQFSKKKDE